MDVLPEEFAGRTAIAVGRRHPMWRDLALAPDSMKAVADPSGYPVLLVCLDPCPQEEVASIQRDGLRIGLCPMRGGYAWLLWTAVAALDAPYSPVLAEPGCRPAWVDDLKTDQSRIAVTLIVLDGQGTVRAIKMVSLSPHVTRTLAALNARALAVGQVSLPAWNAEIAAFNARYPTPQAAFKAAIATCKGGA